eukprot:GILI01022483.1.p1 GENE.GILI01022483.1~~GILI01022483.1.p1  ORF type:complete len:313 (-),score=32.70 GILI01022483.1:105-1043(-)
MESQRQTDWLGRCRTDPPFQPPLRPNLMTALYPGFFSTLGEASKYTGPDPIIIRGEEGAEVARVTCKHSPRLLHNVLPAKETFETKKGWSYNPLCWGTAAQLLVQRWYFRTPDVPVLHNSFFENNMGGFKDQADCTKRIEEAVKALLAANEQAASPRKHLVLFGYSRGATTMLYSALKLAPHLAQHISLVVLEAPFDTFEGVLKDSTWFPNASMTLFKSLCNYSGPEAYTMPNETHLRCPIAIITSDGDTRVPRSCSERCAAAISQRYPHLKVERLMLRTSPHPLLSIGNEADRGSYIAFMERLYATYCPTN